ncbi:MAG: Ppx/GppA family phosphatase [Deltaproteobacteria bacterium]|nr:Ppx/GppA family phosphatase [Deltaproteobacteria bacterium]
MRAAAIDIGTNTVLLLVADVVDGVITPLYEDQRIPRLGKGVDGSGNLSMNKMMEVISVLVEYRDAVYERFGVLPVVVTATSAVRDAANRIEFLWMVEEATGYRIRILTGDEEADITFAGALSMLPEARTGDICVIDIGGGSTELIFASDGVMSRQHSFDVGSVRYSERFGWRPPVEAETDLISQFHQKGFEGSGRRAIGVAGTAGIVKVVSPDLSLQGLIQLQAEWSRLTPETLLARHPDILKGREDVILAGLGILIAAMKAIGADRLEVSAGGIRHGMLLWLSDQENTGS